MIKNRIPKYPPVWFLTICDRFRHFLVRFARKFTAPNATIIELVQGFYVSRAIGVVAELNIAEFLESGNKSIMELAKLSNSHEDSLYRLMRMLASQGVFVEKKDRIFKQNKLSRTLIDDPSSMRFMAIHQVNKVNWNFFAELEHVISTGENAAYKVLGTDIFHHLEANPEKNKIYNLAMNNAALMLSYALVSEYDFSKNKCIVDIGGGQGVLMSVILSKYRKLQGKVFDLAHVVNGAKDIFDNYGVNDRVEAIAGNFYESIPIGGDVYLMKSVIHFLSDEDSINLLKKVKEVLPEKGKLLIIEPIIEEHNRYSFAKLYDIQMMVGLNAGQERTKDEYKALIEQAGLKLSRIIPTAAPFSAIEAV